MLRLKVVYARYKIQGTLIKIVHREQGSFMVREINQSYEVDMTSDYMKEVESRLAERGMSIPEAMAPAANYVPYKIAGNALYVSGQLPAADGEMVKGICGDNISTEDAAKGAELCALNILAQAKAALGDLDKLEGLTKLVGFVASTPEYGEQPAVVNGASNFMVEILGDRGRHARSAVGMASLPFGVTVEVEAIFELKAN